ncbi:MAG TPA: preprotein translocase subunit SecE [Acidisarcina sp.]
MAKAVALTDNTGEPSKGSQITGFATRTGDFLKDVRGEMRKVITPSWKEVQATTTVVIITVFAFAGYFYLVDSIIGRAIQAVLHSLSGAQ